MPARKEVWAPVFIAGGVLLVFALVIMIGASYVLINFGVG